MSTTRRKPSSFHSLQSDERIFSEFSSHRCRRVITLGSTMTEMVRSLEGGFEAWLTAYQIGSNQIAFPPLQFTGELEDRGDLSHYGVDIGRSPFLPRIADLPAHKIELHRQPLPRRNAFKAGFWLWHSRAPTVSFYRRTPSAKFRRILVAVMFALSIETLEWNLAISRLFPSPNARAAAKFPDGRCATRVVRDLLRDENFVWRCGR